VANQYGGAVASVAANLAADGYKVITLDYMMQQYSPIGCEYHPSAEVDAATWQVQQPAIAADGGGLEYQCRHAQPEYHGQNLNRGDDSASAAGSTLPVVPVALAPSCQ